MTVELTKTEAENLMDYLFKQPYAEVVSLVGMLQRKYAEANVKARQTEGDEVKSEKV